MAEIDETCKATCADKRLLCVPFGSSTAAKTVTWNRREVAAIFANLSINCVDIKAEKGSTRNGFTSVYNVSSGDCLLSVVRDGEDICQTGSTKSLKMLCNCEDEGKP